MSVTDWYLIRHAPVLAPVRGGEKILYQSADEPADLSNVAKLDKLAGHLPEGANWLTGPLKRTRATAEALISRKETQVDIVVNDYLIEQDFGDWFGLSFEDLWQEIKHLPPHNWSILAADTCPPGGESFHQVWDRVGDFLMVNTPQENDNEDYLENLNPKIIVSHAGVIRAFIGHILGLSPNMAISFALDPLSMTHLQYSNKDFLGGPWRLVSMNENFGE